MIDIYLMAIRFVFFLLDLKTVNRIGKDGRQYLFMYLDREGWQHIFLSKKEEGSPSHSHDCSLVDLEKKIHAEISWSPGCPILKDLII